MMFKNNIVSPFSNIYFVETDFVFCRFDQLFAKFDLGFDPPNVEYFTTTQEIPFHVLELQGTFSRQYWRSVVPLMCTSPFGYFSLKFTYQLLNYGQLDFLPRNRILDLGYSINISSTNTFCDALQMHYLHNDHHPEFWGDHHMTELAIKEMLLDHMSCVMTVFHKNEIHYNISHVFYVLFEHFSHSRYAYLIEKFPRLPIVFPPRWIVNEDPNDWLEFSDQWANFISGREYHLDFQSVEDYLEDLALHRHYISISSQIMGSIIGTHGLTQRIKYHDDDKFDVAMIFAYTAKFIFGKSKFT